MLFLCILLLPNDWLLLLFFSFVVFIIVIAMVRFFVRLHFAVAVKFAHELSHLIQSSASNFPQNNRSVIRPTRTRTQRLECNRVVVHFGYVCVMIYTRLPRPRYLHVCTCAFACNVPSSEWADESRQKRKYQRKYRERRITPDCTPATTTFSTEIPKFQNHSRTHLFFHIIC